MLAKTQFKKSTLSLSMNSFIPWHHNNKYLCLSIFLTLLSQAALAETPVAIEPSNAQVEPQTSTQFTEDIKKEAIRQGMGSADELKKVENSVVQPTVPDSMQMLQQQQTALKNLPEFAPIEFDDLEDFPTVQVDQGMANDIYQVAEQAKAEAQAYRSGQTKELVVSDATQQEMAEINQAPVNVDQLMQSIQADSKISVEANTEGNTLDFGMSAEEQIAKEPNFFKRMLYKIRPPRELDTAKVPRISADVEIINAKYEGEISNKAYQAALVNLKENIEGKVSSFTQESFEDFPSALPQLRSISNQAAQAVGFYNAEFKFEKTSNNRVRIQVVPNIPVRIEEQNIEFSGAGQYLPQFQVIKVLPEQDVGDVLHHGLYESTKARINEAASNNGFFDSYWRLHDVKVEQPQNTADINLRYETGERYKLGGVEFVMSDSSKPLPIDLDVLQSLVTWEPGADYTFWRVNGLANNLTNSRYFNYSLVDAVRPDPVERIRELPPDLQQLVDEQQLSRQDALIQERKEVVSNREVTQSVVSEAQFAGVNDAEQNKAQAALRTAQETKESEEERLKLEARETKVIPVKVTLNADQLNSVEVGAGYGSDSGARLRAQYRRAIVNRRGHSFDANFELSEIRQSIDGRYNIPYKHPLNDYISLVGGYEREVRDDVGQGVNLLTESAVAGADRVIKNPMGNWQHTYGVRYRLDRLTQKGTASATDIPDAFIANDDPEQESLLLGYEISRIDSDKRVNPSKGIKQTYKIQLGSESLLSDADMAIVNAGWRFIYSLGENDNHQFVGRGDLGYIFTEDFNKVPYNLRYFTGGDQGIRGFDYKSLSPVVDGFKVGGQALAVGSMEYNYQFKEGWRAAVFSDFGNAYDTDFSNDTEYSVGLGVRWASPIGPIRIDVASGISDDSHPIRVHFFIGSLL